MKELLGKPVADSIVASLAPTVEELKNNGVVPTLAVVRVGAREDDLAYERGLTKRFEGASCTVKKIELPLDVTQEELDKVVADCDSDKEIDGILMFRPLPKNLTDKNILNTISALKDVDGMGKANMADIFSGAGEGHAPCTAQAVIEMLKFHGIDIKGKRVTVVGRSLVIGKPVSMLLLKENATVKVCHTRTEDLKAECQWADIVVACAGKAKMLSKDFFREGQIVIDVGMNVDEEGKLCGDVDFSEVCEIVDGITPVPRGVGSVTTSVLLRAVVENAKLR
ncbi:MAG: bifunctional 5,10-methylenetetrahydrofolate dehydrogenase/5,10-methenyltetrahydrofolate cyclohydrolase [Saccharofermentans sp.]|nr:bifunctional 5,10-methylenetetrahydrofolate dehydrogenase/5,10-methenyltetrahydrofolate cyclohydrolase [Saccharofermentans sp.]